MARAMARAMPHELMMPKARKNKTITIGSGILSSEIMVFFDNTNSVLLPATKMLSINSDITQHRAKKTKARMNLTSC